MDQNFFVGIVENRIGDPLKLGRVQCRVFGVHSESLNDVPTSALPWAIPLMPATSASLSGIGHSVTQYIEGSSVMVFFMDGESKQQPVIMGSFHGIPIRQSPFNSESDVSASGGSTAPTRRVTSSVAPSPSSTVSDATGVATEASTATPAEGTIPPVDISKMVAKFGPNVTLVYKTILDYGIREPNAIVAILSNIAKECGFVPKRESLVYSSVDRLQTIFPSFFKNMSNEDALTYTKNEQKLANFVYASRYANGNAASGDGFAFRGGGFIQLTFKSNYQSVGSKIGVDLVNNPNKITEPPTSAKAAVQFLINAYGGANRISFGSLDEALTGVTKKINSGGFANDYPKVQAFSKLCVVIKDAAAEAEKEAEAVAESPNNPENEVKKDATKAEIDAGIVAGSSIHQSSGSIGFSDPNKKYPLTGFLKEPDSNRLSRRNTNQTLVKARMTKKRSGIRSIGGAFNEPAPAYNGQYPFNHVYASEAGHVQEFDDTPGSERIQTYHKSGTFQEVDKYGNRVNKIIGDDYTIIERNGYIYIDGTARVTVGGGVKLMVAGDLEISVDGNLNYDIGGDANFKVGGDANFGVGGEFNVSASLAVNLDAISVNLNSGAAKDIGSSARGGNNNDYPPQLPENFLDAQTISIDDSDADTVDAAHKEAIKNGTMTQSQLDDGNNAKAEEVDENPPAKVDDIATSCLAFKDMTNIPEGTQLSKNFTLAMLSTKAPAGQHAVCNQHGLNIAQIVCNLKTVAENCLDKIKAQYPNMFVTSGFRTGSGTSQHERGQACDMQFRGVSNSGFYEIAQWIKDNVSFDQLLLEYKTTGTGNAWIHISHAENNRKIVLTMMNNKTAGQGLRKLQ